jgi:putative transcriptional regulator
MPGRARYLLKLTALVWATVPVILGDSPDGVRRREILPVQAESASKNLAAGKLLVARRKLLDPNFAQTVVLLIQYDEKGSVGLIINRQSKIPLSKLSAELSGAKGRSELLFVGGPVERLALMALLRTRTKPEEARHVFADVYAISSKPTLEKTLASDSTPSTLRLYLGYAGWAAGQLEFEIGINAWEVLPYNAAFVFDAHPESLWPRLAEAEELQIASLKPE